ncbi:SNF2 family N-terminal domain-containing protein [Kalaharituber pfeilii]|nr:SNF2 family N-terminal domain-containing protein [Kalaharituber pfeilii]
MGGLAAAYSRPRQNRPDRAQAIVDLHLEDIRDLDMRRKVERIKTVIPGKSNKAILIALQEKKGNFDDAMDLLTAEDEVVDFTKGSKSSGKQHGSVTQTSKRGARAPRKAITEKWSSTQARERLPSSSPEVQAKPRRRLVKGSRGICIDSPPAPIELDDDDDSEHSSDDADEGYELKLEGKVLEFINTCEIEDLIDIAATTEEIAQTILRNRPYRNIDVVRAVSIGQTAPKKGKRGGQKRAVGDRVVDECIETFRGYEAVDTLIKKCEELGKPLAEAIKGWGVDVTGAASKGELEIVNLNMSSRADSGIGTPADDDDDDITTHGRHKTGLYMTHQPKNLAPGVTLKDYQLVGINWLNLLYQRKLSCILADEMGLGKTCQVVAFFAHLLSIGEKGPHLVVVPASTLENWLREFKTFCPDLVVEPYYGNQKERVEIRDALRRHSGFHVLVTTYNLATGDKYDRGFLKEQKFNICVYDEGHMLKNSGSSRYSGLMQLPAKFRLLLTGTPLQNNLKELASLLAFILPNVFRDKKNELETIFKHKAKTSDEGEASSALLSATRIQKAKAMMTPFVLRRKKQQVLGKHLPEKTTRVEYCELNEIQKEIYDKEIALAKEAIEARAEGRKPTKATSNLLMQLRKAAIHPFLFRRHFTDPIINKMSKAIMKEDAYKDNDAKYIEEDMSVMNDFELNRLCLAFPKSLGKYAFKKDEWMQAGKIDTLKRLVLDFKSNGDRILIFSQFTQVMDILETVMDTLGVTYFRLDGSTKVEDRQDMIDQFYDEQDITVFLLSTKAGGFGINLACANKVIIFDSSFNPHDDRQAADRAHRVGQTRPVEVINLVARGTIEEQILALANTKLALDQSVSGEESADAVTGKGEQLVAKMMLGMPTTPVSEEAGEEGREKEE